MQRVHVTGNAGVGKTTAAYRLGLLLGLDVVSLDSIVWQPGWRKTPADERHILETTLAARSSWVIDGVSAHIRSSADTVVFLDYPRRVALFGCLRRNWRYLFRSRPGLPEQCPEILIIPRLLRLVWRFPKHVRPQILDYFESPGSAPRLVHVRSRREPEAYLDGLTSAKACDRSARSGRDRTG